MAEPVPLLSVVVPLYGEARVLPDFLARLGTAMESLACDYEVVLVDDGSTDGTFQDIVSFHDRDQRIRGVSLSRNFGKEAALLAGLEHAMGDAVVTIDGDLQHPPEAIKAMVAAWRGGADIVHGVKSDRANEGVLRRSFSRLFNRMFQRMTGVVLADASDFKLLDREVVRLLCERFPERERFFRGLTAWLGFQQAFVPFQVGSGGDRQSRWSFFGLAAYAIDSLTAFSSLPLQLVPLLGVLMLFISVVLGAEALLSRLAGSAVSGFATLEITLLFVGSLIMIGLGVVGRYLASIYNELKHRPIYVVRRRIGFKELD